MANVIFDTNIYIFHSFKYPDVLKVWDEYAVTKGYNVYMSTIQISELLSYEKIDQHPKLKAQREKYISLADEILLVDERIARKAAELRRVWKKHSGKSLKLPETTYTVTWKRKRADRKIKWLWMIKPRIRRLFFGVAAFFIYF